MERRYTNGRDTGCTDAKTVVVCAETASVRTAHMKNDVDYTGSEFASPSVVFSGLGCF